ncbi:MAG: sigma-E processing peptidase SpoIIGA [Clostridia bacterium]|nr:sigma-E processing peptidase SpoIIGA [Clostridia bacterium]
MQTVYVDLYFLINFSMDFLCLYLTSKLLSVKLPLFRGLLAAAVGGIYANVALLLPIGGISSVLLDAAVCALICFTAFWRKREWKRLFLYILIYTAVSAALGGAMTALYYIFNRTDIFGFIRESDGDGLSVWLFALLAIISAAITLVGGRGFTKRMSAREAEVEITYLTRSVRLHGICDSGNLLRDPISGKPCIVADRSKMKEILPETLLSADAAGLERLSADERRRIVLIPTKTVSGEGMLIGIRVEKIKISVGGRAREADAVVALSGLSDSEALVPSCLLV